MYPSPLHAFLYKPSFPAYNHPFYYAFLPFSHCWEPWVVSILTEPVWPVLTNNYTGTIFLQHYAYPHQFSPQMGSLTFYLQTVYYSVTLIAGPDYLPLPDLHAAWFTAVSWPHLPGTSVPVLLPPSYFTGSSATATRPSLTPPSTCPGTTLPSCLWTSSLRYVCPPPDTPLPYHLPLEELSHAHACACPAPFWFNNLPMP